jgi:hypothetical protein
MSSIIPSAIIAINSNISNNTLNKIISQLNIDEILDLLSYKDNLLNDNEYHTKYLLSNKRLLVLYPIGTSENLLSLNFNVICKVKNGLISILEKVEPRLTFKITNLSWDKLSIYNYNRSTL